MGQKLRGILLEDPLEVVEAVSQSWEPVVGPDHWTHETGMELTIPEGWRGTRQEAPILEIEHTDLKVAVSIAEAAGPLETPNPWQLLRERHPCERFARTVRAAASEQGLTALTPQGAASHKKLAASRWAHRDTTTVYMSESSDFKMGGFKIWLKI